LLFPLFCLLLPSHHLIEVLIVSPCIRRLFHVSVQFLQEEVLLLLFLFLLYLLRLLYFLLFTLHNFLKSNVYRLVPYLLRYLLRIFIDHWLIPQLFKSV
jgi:hypothetical protein